METQNENERVRGDAWIGKRVIVKSTAGLLYLIPVTIELIATNDNGRQIQVNNIPNWSDKENFELFKP